MRRMLALAGLAAVVLTIVGSPAPAQEFGAPGRLFNQPAELRAVRSLRRIFPEYYGRSFAQEVLITENFFPVGWSKDGKFAYYTEPGDEACGCYFGQLIILDTVSDKELWSFKYDGLDHQDKPKYRAITDLWRKNRKLFSDKLNQYGIIPQARFGLLKFPINNAGDQLRADLKIEENKDEETRIYSKVKKATLQISSRRGGTKTVYQESYPEYGPLDMKVLGYLKSPYEQRVAIILLDVQRGYEGPPHTTHVKVVGASLATGFK
jgi:hypothetical protein